MGQLGGLRVVLCAVAMGASAVRLPAQVVHNVGPGTPSISLRNGRKVITSFSGGSPAGAKPLALASADFDEDGMPDLASGYAAADGTGIVTLHRGNVDALWPYGKAIENGEPPAFHPEARVFTLPEAPDFLGAGDFDADGHWDLVAAHLGGKALYLLRGDGHGGLAAAERIAVPGAITAFTTGEINRTDGLTDIALGVTGEDGAQVLVFESPRGALRGDPETFPMPATVSALAMLALDDSHFSGLAVGAENELIAIHGRDRKLTHLKSVRDAVPPAEITRQTLPFAVRALAAGRFTSARLLDLAALGDDGAVHFLERPDAGYQAARAELPVTMAAPGGLAAIGHARAGNAGPLPKKPDQHELVLRDAVALPSRPDGAAHLVTARASANGGDDVLVVDGAARQLHLITRAARGAKTMARTASLETAGSPAAVLPMRLAPSALHGLVVLENGRTEPSVLPQQSTATFEVTNTGDAGPVGSNPSNTAMPGSLRWAITSANNSPGTPTITFNIPTTDPNYNAANGTFTITPLPTTGNNCPLDQTSGQRVCAGLPGLNYGIVLDGYTQPGASPNTLANGDNAVIKIVISGASAGNGPSGIDSPIGAATIRGIDAIGFHTATLPTETAGGDGITMTSTNNIVEGNFAGVDVSGTNPVPNREGVSDFGGGQNTIGGTTPQARNLLSGNAVSGFGQADDYLPPYLFQGNYLGTDRTGTISVSNGADLNIAGTNMTIGGTAAGAANLISGTYATSGGVGGGGPGLQLAMGPGNSFTPDSNTIQGNLIGTDSTGAHALGNASGITVNEGAHNLIGGTTPAARNIVSGNFSDGIDIGQGATSTSIQGNYIGLDVTGTKKLGNGVNGILDQLLNPAGGPDGLAIGGEYAGNVISGNTFNGINFGASGPVSSSGTLDTVLGNLIGTDASGNNPMGNGSVGIQIVQGSGFITIGGSDPTAGNVIANNGQQGILINSTPTYPGSGHVDSIVANSIFSNSREGIALQAGVADEFSQNAIYSNGGLGIDIGNPTPQTGSCPPATAGPNKVQNPPVLVSGSSGTLVTATAIDPNGNTSQFSNCAKVAASGGTLNILGSIFGQPNTTYTIEFFQNTACDPSGSGQGQAFLNSISVKTDANCITTFGDTVNPNDADISVTLGESGTVALQNAVYTASVVNQGGATAATVTFSDTLPANETFVSVTTTVGTCGNAGNAVTCNLGTMPSGATATIAITATINVSGGVSNTATVSSPTPDSNSANNSATSTITANYLGATLDHVDPTTAIAGLGAIPMLIYGMNFYAGVTTVTANSTNLTYTIVSEMCGTFFPVPCQGLEVTLPATLTAAPGTVTISVANPTPNQTTASGTVTFYPNPGSAAQFQITGLPAVANPGTQYTMTITALDMNGNVVKNYQGVVNLTVEGLFGFNPSPQSLSGTTNPASPYQFTAGDQGSHNFAVTFGAPSGGVQYLVFAQDAAAPIQGSASGSIAAGNGDQSYVQGATPDPVPIGLAFDMPFTITITDDNGLGIAQIPVTFAAPGSGASGTFSNGQNTIVVNSNANGVASALLTANQTAGQFAVTGTLNVPFAGPTAVGNWTVTSTSDVPTSLTVVAGSPQSEPVNTQFPVAPQVIVKDAQGHGIPYVTVNFSAPGSGASVLLPAATAVTAAAGSGTTAGVATLAGPIMANASAGSYSLTAALGSLNTPFALTNTSGPNPAASLNGTGSGQMATVFTKFGASLTVMPLDSKGNCLAQVPITFSPPASGPSANLSANIVNSDPVTCTAQVVATANGIVGGPYNVTATAPGGASTTFALTNTTDAGYLTAVSGTPQMTPPSQAFSMPLKAQLLDAFQNPWIGQLVTFSAPATGPSAILSSSSAITDYTGTATITATANSSNGSYYVTANFGQVSTVFALSNSTFSACDVNQDGKTDINDVQKMINEGLGAASPANDLNSDTKVNAVDIQIVIDAVLHLGCSAS